MNDFSDFVKAMGLIFGVPFLAFMLLISPFISHLFTLCPSAIFGEENTLGARIYINGEFAGAMEKYTYKMYQKQYTDVRLCRWIEKGDHLRAEKEGYRTYTATLKPSYNDSDSPVVQAWIELVPLAREEPSEEH